MSVKKTEFVAFRTDTKTKMVLEDIAEKKKWTVSVVVGEIVRDWLSKHKTVSENEIRTIDRWETL